MMFVKGFVEAKNRPKILYFTKEQINVGEFYANEYDLIGYKFNGYYCIRTTQEFYDQIDNMVEDINWRWLQGVIEAKGKISKNNGNVKVDIRIKNRKIFNRINTILENINIKRGHFVITRVQNTSVFMVTT